MKVVIRMNDDWIAIYVDGKKIDEGHNLTATDALDAIAIEYEVQEFNGEPDTVESDEFFPEQL